MIQLTELGSFRNRDRALANAVSLSRDLPEDLSSRLFFLAGASADPDAALQALVRFHADNPAGLRRIAADSALPLPLITVFANSRFLTEEILQEPDWLEDAVSGGDLHTLLSVEELELRLEAFLHSRGAGAPTALLVAQFRRKQILRVLLRDLSGLCTLAETTAELSNLADAILNVTYLHIRDELVKKHGQPQCDAGPCEFSVISLGKLGGQELNYSSDIDLMYVYTANGETTGPRSISNKEFFIKAAHQLTALLSSHTAEGVCYRVDLRLRPEGTLGEMCLSLDAMKNYYQNRGRDWELQMLIKARVSAGDRGLGQELLEFVEPLTYRTTLDFSAIEAVSEARERIQEKLQQRRADSRDIDVKLARGGIRDIEFLVQCLQRMHGGRDPWVRHGGTLLALSRLRDKSLLSDLEYSRLASAYEFLRHLEHRLQLEDDRQTHVLPQSPDHLDILAHRMPAPELGSDPTRDRLMERLAVHFHDVQEIYERVIHTQEPEPERPAPAANHRVSEGPANLMRYLEQRAPNLTAMLARTRMKRGMKAFDRFLDWLAPQEDWLHALDSDDKLTGYLIEIFEHSPYFADQLMRFPELLEELRRVRQSPGHDLALTELDHVHDANELRRLFRREMFRIQAESICLASPVFETLERTSSLAEAAIHAAYFIAVRETIESHPPQSPAYTPRDQMMVIALGRLGMREFDLSSDADLIFVLPDSDAAEHQFWTRTATKLIERLSAYTREGSLFAVDTRLRPNGRAGHLVQLESAYKDYFSQRAEAWEGITYMKARAVAGNIDRSTRFLNELQELDWRRYGQSERSQKQLRQMRLRLEKEQGGENHLKGGRGGYYDIDFSLMYLRLKGAGIFFKVLNTPERIDVIEKMGLLDRTDAAFLRDAAIFYRALDHGLRLLTGQAEGYLPKSPVQMEMLSALVRRWTPAHLHDQPVETELRQIQERTRKYFDRLFAE